MKYTLAAGLVSRRSSRANQHPSDWLSYDAQSGDTVAAVALRAGVSVAALRSANALPPVGAVIYPGQRLWVPPNAARHSDTEKSETDKSDTGTADTRLADTGGTDTRARQEVVTAATAAVVAAAAGWAGAGGGGKQRAPPSEPAAQHSHSVQLELERQMQQQSQFLSAAATASLLSLSPLSPTGGYPNDAAVADYADRSGSHILLTGA
ncbi:hypothetical protein T492DRAFT_889050 [Pavlovales sp. CCMP2436]|nr:hypothetical protein T492DRAFT_889050 [Pavlovales sp. CCMP2436]